MLEVKVSCATKCGELGDRGAVFLVRVCGLRRFCTKSRSLRRFFRQVNPATQKYGQNLFLQYMRRAGENLSFSIALTKGLHVRLLSCKYRRYANEQAIVLGDLSSLQAISRVCGRTIWRLLNSSCQTPSGYKSLNCLPCFLDSGCGR